MLPTGHGLPVGATGTPRRLRIANMFSLLSATIAVLPAGRFSRAADIGSIGARRDVWSVTGCPSSVEPGAGSWVTVRPFATAIASTIFRERVVGLANT